MTARAAAGGKERRRGARSSRSLRARMFACYYCRQISTSCAADAHYNCKRERLPRRVISEDASGMCTRECSESARGNRSRDHPASLSSLLLFPSGMAEGEDAREEDESNHFELRPLRIRGKMIRERCSRPRPRLRGICGISINH